MRPVDPVIAAFGEKCAGVFWKDMPVHHNIATEMSVLNGGKNDPETMLSILPAKRTQEPRLLTRLFSSPRGHYNTVRGALDYHGIQDPDYRAYVGGEVLKELWPKIYKPLEKKPDFNRPTDLFEHFYVELQKKKKKAPAKEKTAVEKDLTYNTDDIMEKTALMDYVIDHLLNKYMKEPPKVDIGDAGSINNFISGAPTPFSDKQLLMAPLVGLGAGGLAGYALGNPKTRKRDAIVGALGGGLVGGGAALGYKHLGGLQADRASKLNTVPDEVFTQGRENLKLLEDYHKSWNPFKGELVEASTGKPIANTELPFRIENAKKLLELWPQIPEAAAKYQRQRGGVSGGMAGGVAGLTLAKILDAIVPPSAAKNNKPKAKKDNNMNTKTQKQADMLGALGGGASMGMGGAALGAGAGGLYGLISGALGSRKGQRLRDTLTGGARGLVGGGLLGGGTGVGLGASLGGQFPAGAMLNGDHAAVTEALQKINPNVFAGLTTAGTLGGAALGGAAANTLLGRKDNKDDKDNKDTNDTKDEADHDDNTGEKEERKAAGSKQAETPDHPVNNPNLKRVPMSKLEEAAFKQKMKTNPDPYGLKKKEAELKLAPLAGVKKPKNDKGTSLNQVLEEARKKRQAEERDLEHKAASALLEALKEAASTPAYRKGHKAQNRARYAALLKADGYPRPRSFKGANPALLDAHRYKDVKERWEADSLDMRADAAEGGSRRTNESIARANSKEAAYEFGKMIKRSDFILLEALKEAASTPAYRKGHKAQNRARYAALLKADGYPRPRSFEGANPALLDAHHYKNVKERWDSDKRDMQFDAAYGGSKRTNESIARANSKFAPSEAVYEFGKTIKRSDLMSGLQSAGDYAKGVWNSPTVQGFVKDPTTQAGLTYGGIGAGLGGLYGLVNPGEYEDEYGNVRRRGRLMGALRGAAGGGVMGGLAGAGAQEGRFQYLKRLMSRNNAEDANALQNVDRATALGMADTWAHDNPGEVGVLGTSPLQSAHNAYSAATNAVQKYMPKRMGMAPGTGVDRQTRPAEVKTTDEQR